jgi:hypothetical protein
MEALQLDKSQPCLRTLDEACKRQTQYIITNIRK